MLNKSTIGKGRWGGEAFVIYLLKKKGGRGSSKNIVGVGRVVQDRE